MPYEIDESRFIEIPNQPLTKAPAIDFTGITYAANPAVLNVAIDHLFDHLNKSSDIHRDSTDILYVLNEVDRNNLLLSMTSFNQFPLALVVICRAAGFNQAETAALLKELPSRKIRRDQSLQDVYTGYMPLVEKFEEMLKTVPADTRDKLHSMINDCNPQGMRPIDFAALGNNPSLFRLLTVGGAVVDQTVRDMLTENAYPKDSKTQLAMREYAGMSTNDRRRLNRLGDAEDDVRAHSKSNASDPSLDITDPEIRSDSEPDSDSDLDSDLDTPDKTPKSQR